MCKPCCDCATVLMQSGRNSPKAVICYWGTLDAYSNMYIYMCVTVFVQKITGAHFY